jgi:hypothetical protein
MRDPDVVQWTTAQLQNTRRELAMSLGLTPPASQAGVVIPNQLAAIDAELARRPKPVPHGLQGQPLVGAEAVARLIAAYRDGVVECGDTGRPDDIDTPADLARITAAATEGG